MKQKIRLIGPVILLLVILLSCAAGGWLWYDSNVDRSGWTEKDGVRIYQDFHADPVSGWLELDGSRYYFQDGVPHTGWLEEGGITYFFEDSGIMHTGWLEENGKTHYFGGNGSMVSGWLWLEDRYYLRDGILVTGWQEIDGDTYYFDKEGIMALGFAELDGNTYYFEEGVMLTGTQTIGDQQYLFLEDGVMHTGWLEPDDKTAYYYREDGTQAFGWEEVGGTRYFFDEDGILCLDRWVQDGEYKYYIFGDGTYATGPTVINDQLHYFTPKGIEVILVNAINPLPAWHKQEIVNFVDNHDVDARCYDALTNMLEDFEEQVGIEYTFNSAYRTWNEQTAILEYRTLEHMRDYGLSFADARAKALETVAIPDTSEHQLGLSVDLVGYSINQWLAEHCWEYGFILRYPENKQHITGITNEPWHFRYVGREVSMDMKDSGLCLEEYLGADPVTREAIEALHGDKWHREEFYTVDEETIAKYTKKDEA